MELAAPIEAVFAFHGDPRNAAKITPAGLSIKVVRGACLPAAGEDFEIELSLLGLRLLRWHGVWQEVAYPTRLVDGALRSPFVYWRHRHLFERLNKDRTRLTDHVSYQFPGGWLGKLFGETLGRLQFHFMFADRQRRTVRWVREHSIA